MKYTTNLSCNISAGVASTITVPAAAKKKKTSPQYPRTLSSACRPSPEKISEAFAYYEFHLYFRLFLLILSSRFALHILYVLIQ